MNSRQNSLFYLVIVILFSTISIRVASQSIVTFGWGPYVTEEDGTIRGITTEIVQEIMHELQDSIPIIRIRPTHDLIQKMFNDNKEMMLYPIQRKEHDEHQFKWIGPIIEDTVYFYKKAGSSVSIQTLEDAKSFRVVCFRHGFIKNDLEQKGFVNLEPYRYTEIINKFIEGDADLIACGSAISVAYFLREANFPIDTLDQTPVRILVFSFYIQCKSDISDEKIQQWQIALDQLKSSGKYMQIYQKYLDAAY